MMHHIALLHGRASDTGQAGGSANVMGVLTLSVFLRTLKPSPTASLFQACGK